MKLKMRNLALQTLLALGVAAFGVSSASASSFVGSPSPSLSPVFGILVDFDDKATGTAVGAFDYVSKYVASITETTGSGAAFARYAGTQSLPNFVGTGFGHEIGGAPLGWDAHIVIEFMGLASKVGIGVANSAGGPETIFAYDQNHVLLESFLVPTGLNVYVGFDRLSRDIKYFEITGDFVAIDDLQHNVAPIPEPEIYAMLTAGLGLMGFVARRRKQQLVAA